MEGANGSGTAVRPFAQGDEASGDRAAFAEAEARVGQVLRNKYSIDRVLGVGGMASVYVATHRNRQRFAVKMLHPELSVHATVRARFLGEGYRANSVKHPGVVKVLDDDVAEDGSVFLVMELLDGESLDRVAQRHGSHLPLREVLAIGDQLLDVLAAADAAGLVHRDIKPANLFLTRDGTLKVLDFGIARLETAGGQLTHAGALMGTPGFMAPEQARGQSSEIDGRTDIWAAGATLFSLLAGAPVHAGETSQMLMLAAATRPAPSLRTMVPDAPPAVIAIIDLALQFNKAARWQNAALMRSAIRDAYLQVFEEEISPAPLIALLQSPGATATTVPARPRTAPSSDVPASVPPVSRTAILTASDSPATPPSFVEDQPSVAQLTAPPARRSRHAGVTLALAAVAAAVAWWFSFRAPRPKLADPPSPSVVTQAATGPAPPLPASARPAAPAAEHQVGLTDEAPPSSAPGRGPRSVVSHKAGHHHQVPLREETVPQGGEGPPPNPLKMPLQ